MSRKSGRPVRKPKRARIRIAALPMELAATRRSKTVGPLQRARHHQGGRDEDGDHGGGEHQRRALEGGDAAVHLAVGKPVRAGLAVSAWTRSVAVAAVDLDGDRARREGDGIGVGDDADRAVVCDVLTRTSRGEIGSAGLTMIRATASADWPISLTSHGQ